MLILKNIIENIFINEFLNKDLILNNDIENYKLKIINNDLYFMIYLNNKDNLIYDYEKLNELIINYVNEKFYKINFFNRNEINNLKYDKKFNNRLLIIFSYEK